MKKKLDISMHPQIESGEYQVTTAAGCPVEYMGVNPNQEMMFKWNGIIYPARELSLVVDIPEPELTDFEIHVQAVMKNSGLIGCTECYKDIETVKTTSKSLLDIARKELTTKYDATKVDEGLIDSMMLKFKGTIGMTCEVTAYRSGLVDMYKQFAEELEIAFNHQDDVVYDRGYDNGYSNGNADALKDIPHWTPSTAQNGIYDYHRLVWNGYKIEIEELFAKLPKDELADKYGCN